MSPKKPCYLVAAQYGKPAPVQPRFAVMEFSDYVRQRILRLEELRRLHDILWLAVDDIEVHWNWPASIESTWATFRRKRVLLEGFPLWQADDEYVRSLEFRVEDLLDLPSDELLVFRTPARWRGGEQKAFRDAAITWMVQRELIGPRDAAKERARYGL